MRLAHVSEHRPRLRQRAGAPRPGMAAEVGLRRDCRTLTRDQRHSGPARQADRREGLSCRAVRGRALSGDGSATLSEFAAWMRLDRPGRDAALLRPYDGGWLLQGAAAFDHDGASVAVAYQVEVDARW